MRNMINVINKGKCFDCSKIEDNYDISYPHHEFYCTHFSKIISLNEFNILRECCGFDQRYIAPWPCK